MSAIEQHANAYPGTVSDAGRQVVRNLRCVLLEPTSKVRDLKVRQKHQCVFAFNWFRQRSIKLRYESKEPGSAQGFFANLDYADDLFDSDISLLRCVREYLAQQFAALNCEFACEIQLGARQPLKLYIEAGKVDALRSRLPQELLEFATVEVDPFGPVTLDSLSVDSFYDAGTLSGYVTVNSKCYALTAAHACRSMVGSERPPGSEIYFEPGEGVDVAVIPLPELRKNPVPFSHPIALQEFIRNSFADKKDLIVYKIGSATGLTSGKLYFPYSNAEPPCPRQERVLDNQIQYKKLILVNWGHVPFSRPQDSGSVVFAELKGLFHPLGIHVASSSLKRASFFLPVHDCLSRITLPVIDESTGEYRWENPREGSFKRAPPPPAHTLPDTLGDDPNLNLESLVAMELT